jgi:hypothetical protein
MFRVAYFDAKSELLVNGSREDYAELRDAVRQAVSSRSEVVLAVRSDGETAVSNLVVRSGAPPNRVSYEGGRVVFSVAPSMQKQFLSFVEFPADADLPRSRVQYHHHYDALGDDGTYVALDSLPVVFALERV